MADNDAMALDKGKGKAVEDTPMGQDMSMDEEDDSSEESGPEDIVCVPPLSLLHYPAYTA